MPTATKKKETEPRSYREAMEELETIVAQVDDRNVDIDVLSEKVKRAHELVAFCQTRIDAVRFEVENILEPQTAPKKVKASKDILDDEPF